MIIRVRLFAAAKELAGTDVLEVVVSCGATVAQLRQTVVDRVPKLETIVRHSLWAVGTEYVGDVFELREADDVALIPPVSGG